MNNMKKKGPEHSAVSGVFCVKSGIKVKDVAYLQKNTEPVLTFCV